MQQRINSVRWNDMQKLLLCLSWFVLTVALFVANASAVRLLTHKRPLEFAPSTASTVTAPLENTSPVGSVGISTILEAQDARPEIIAEFLKRHDSPLTPYEHFAKFIVDTADKYNVDYRLIPAIMMQESNLCKAIPPGSYNCLGFGIHAKGTLTFDSYEESIERATRELKANYIDIDLTTPEEIMTKYTPGSNGSWAASVNQWIAEMEYNDRAKGKSEKSDADLTVYTAQ
ncbi:MAG TPA: hypothetical protein DCX25_00665 [Candidatus Pacebacteria bacterium]|nr:hypothetical protein [Candidatus Paceibacterota bacterium]HCR11223.1 hypothetical protein [Candidatus Paceibacterota bacterium]